MRLFTYLRGEYLRQHVDRFGGLFWVSIQELQALRYI
jgi:hypothetical protein